MNKFISIVVFAVLIFAPLASNTVTVNAAAARYTLNTSSFRDVSPNSKLRPALDWAVENEFLKAGGFFRASEPMPALMFWPLVLQEAGFDKNNATFHTPLPPNISDDDPLANFLREAIRRNFIDPEEIFDPLGEITQLTALSVLVKTKALLPPRRTSSTFQSTFDIKTSRQAKYLPLLETALASNMITSQDVTTFRPTVVITRGTLLRWLHRFATEGEKKSIMLSSQPVQKKTSSVQNALQKKLAARRSSKSKSSGTTIKITKNKNSNTSSSNSISTSGDIVHEEFTILRKIFLDLTDEYRFPEQLTAEKKRDMVEAATEAMVRELGDKYTTYIKPSKTKAYEDGLNGEIEGIGAYVEMMDGKVVVTAPITGSPAEQAGILPGDIVTHVDGANIENDSLTDSVQKIKGKAGTTVLLTILRNDHSLKVLVPRGKIKIPSVTLKWNQSVPILGIHQFNRTTSEAMLKKIKEDIIPKSPRGLILDLRNNPGGYLTEAVEVGEIFLNRGDVVFSTEYKKSEHDYIASRNGELRDMNKIVVLQNKGTASASEILIHALKDYERTKIVGEVSHGKGVVQNLAQYNHGGILKLTIAKWLSPRGIWLDGEGIKPDVEVASPNLEQKKQQIDPQLDRAIQELLRW